MTEKEFVHNSVRSAVDILGNPNLYRIARLVALEALKNAKQCGAEFDREMLELPDEEPFKPDTCDGSTYELYKILARRPMNTLTFSDYLMLTGHEKCCGTRLQGEMTFRSRKL